MNEESTITIPSGPLKPNKVENAEKTFFFERHDGSVVAVKEQEAWHIMTKGNQKVGVVMPLPKLIGVSDGSKFRQAVMDAHKLHAEGKTDEARERLRQGEAEELEAARGHIEHPRNFDVTDNNGQPTTLVGTKIR